MQLSKDCGQTNLEVWLSMWQSQMFFIFTVVIATLTLSYAQAQLQTYF